MHRSGTTLIAKILSEFGIFLGAKLSSNLESPFFFRLNEWIMRRAGGAWDYPVPTKKFLQVSEFRSQAHCVVINALTSRWFAEYTGKKKDWFVNGLSRLNQPWGWKDPRNIFTFSIWSNIFSEAKVLYIKRNGIDVANSLLIRTNQSISQNRPVFSPFRLLGRLKASLRPFGTLNNQYQSGRCTSLEGGFRIWEEYGEEAESIYKEYDGEKIMIRYEDFLQRPKDYLGDILSFANRALQLKSKKIDDVISIINQKRAFAFVRDEKLVQFYYSKIHSNLTRKLGYDKIHSDIF